jgi:hypothetical protein
MLPTCRSCHEQDLTETLVGLEPRSAHLPPGPPLLLGVPDTLEERLVDGVEAAEGLLLGGEGMAALPVRVGRADLLELDGLIAVGDRHPTQPPGLAPLLQRGVVQVTVVTEQPCRAALLGRVG